MVETLPSRQEGSTIDALQCVYRTEDLVGSVSLTLTVPRAGVAGGARAGARFLRISVGGVREKPVRQERASRLASQGSGRPRHALAASGDRRSAG